MSSFSRTALYALLCIAPQWSSAQGGRAVFEQSCAACHLGGMGGAPAIADRENWRKRLEQGTDVLVQHALEGLRAMPARGGNATLTDAEVRAAVVYMIGRVRAAR